MKQTVGHRKQNGEIRAERRKIRSDPVGEAPDIEKKRAINPPESISRMLRCSFWVKRVSWQPTSCSLVV